MLYDMIFAKERRAELELEEALDDNTLSADERKIIEDQLCMIRRKFGDMLANMYA